VGGLCQRLNLAAWNRSAYVPDLEYISMSSSSFTSTSKLVYNSPKNLIYATQLAEIPPN